MQTYKSFVDSFEAQLNAKRERLLVQLHQDVEQLKADLLPAPLAFEPGQPIEEAQIEPDVPTEEEMSRMYEAFTAGEVIAE